MRGLVHRYLNKVLSRREFVRRLAKRGFSVTATASIIDSLAPLARADAASLRRVEGTGGELLVAQLPAAGVKFIFNCNSSHTYLIFDALLDCPDIHVIQVPREGQAVAIAQGYAPGSGQFGYV